MNGPYHRALFAVVTAQLSTGQRHADGVAGLLALLRDMPLVRRAVAAHARTRGISLRERLAPPAAASHENAAALSAASQQWAVLYAAFDEESGGDECGGDERSGELCSSGDQQQRSEAAVALRQPSSTTPDTAGASPSSPEGVQAAQLLECSEQMRPAAEQVDPLAAAPSKSARRRCLQGGCEGALSSGVRLRENVLDMGAAPNMRSCCHKQGRRRLWLGGNASAGTGAAAAAHTGRALEGGAAPQSALNEHAAGNGWDAAHQLSANGT